MTPERWQEVKHVLASALERPPQERRAYLDQACIEPDLRREVESLIAAHEQGDTSFMGQVTVTSVPLQKGAQLGQYTILEHIGAGGMGEVYRARDTRLSRNVAIKVLPSLFSDDPDRLRRFEQEAQAAAALNHPNILAVHQMGTHEGAPYLVSELLEGSTLREQLKRGPLPLRKAIDCGVQIARGLAAAHEKGIVHRDLKPENLFLTKDGRVKILDFGLAKLTQREGPVDSKAPTVSRATEPGVVMGTVGYMAPEQVSGKAADHRADIFAFGAILYEMLTGKRAFQKPTAVETMNAILNEDPPAVSQLAPTCPPALQRVVQRCLEKNPEQRFQSASDLAFALEALSESGGPSPAAIARPASRRIWPWAAAALVFVVLGVATGGYFYLHRAPKLTEKDSIVLADFTNTTGDPVFDAALRQGLSAQLEQTPFLRIVSGDQIAQTLSLMEKPADTPLTHDVTREVCQRMNATVAIEGSIAALGSQYVLGLNALDCRTGDMLAQEQVTADGKEKVLTALGNASSRLRSKLGESTASLQAYDAPLDKVTTPSLEALKAWGLGADALVKGDLPSTVSSMQRAVSLDPKFAVAYSTLGTAYWFLGQNRLAVENVAKGYNLRERASEREKFSISGNYYLIASRDLEKATQTFEQWAKTFPRDPPAWYALTGSHWWAGRYEEGLATAREAMRLNPTPFSYSAVALDYFLLGRLDEARATIGQAEANHMDPAAFRGVLYSIAFVQGDAAEMAKQLAGPWIGDAPGAAEDAQSSTAAYYGHLASAREYTRGAVESARRQGAEEASASFEMESAIREGIFGNIAEAKRAATDSEIGSSNPEIEGSAAIVFAMAGDAERAQKLAKDLAQHRPDDTTVQSNYLPAVRGLLAVDRRNMQEALETLGPASPYELGLPQQGVVPALLSVYARGQVYLEAHQGTQAAAEFQKILDHPGLVGNAPIGALAHLGLGRAYALQGDTAKAKTAYQDFLVLWKDADPDIPILKQAKAEYAKVQ